MPMTKKMGPKLAAPALPMSGCSRLLKELRQKEAKKKSLPPFVIFLETSLQDMATLYPHDDR
jgi:ATP-dependent DNA helicase RecQ